MKHLIFCIFLVSNTVLASSNSMDVIYGEDNRKDVYESTNSIFVELSKSTAAMIPTSNLKQRSRGETQIIGSSLKEMGICSSERFSAQMTAANCSGFLIKDDLLVTAGHCIKSEVDCRNNRWVFDYKVDFKNQKFVNVPSSSVYGCKKIISRSLDSVTQDDYAVIQLDRRADRRPLGVRSVGKVSTGAPLVVIGHPSGLPTKISDGAVVRALKPKYFVANLDTYGGNSGSAVFNVITMQVEGILVRGENDYVFDPKLGCQVSYRCKNDACRGEDVTYITNIKALQSLL